MNDGNNVAQGLCVAAFIAIPLWGAIWFGAVYATGIFIIGGRP